VAVRLARFAPGAEVEIIDASHGLDMVEPVFIGDRVRAPVGGR
jgi:hypothetical protein